METGAVIKEEVCYYALNIFYGGLFGAVLVLQQQNGYVRCVDVAEHLGVTKPSVSRAVKELSKKKCLIKKDDGTLSLTEQGQQIAKCIYEKHQFFTKQLIEPVFPTILQHKMLVAGTRY